MKGDIKMKKILFTIAIVLTIGLTAGAQGRIDGFFGSYSNNDIYGNRDAGITLGTTTAQPGLPTTLGYEYDSTAPLGSGLLILTALGAGYAVARKKSKK